MVAKKMKSSEDNSQFGQTKLSVFLSKHIDALQGIKSQAEIAREIGYTRPNIVSMFKTGGIKVPIDKIPALAKAIDVDVGFLMRLALEQYWPDKLPIINDVFGRTVSESEFELVELFRSATKNGQDRLTDPQRRAIKKIFQKPSLALEIAQG